MLSWIETVIHSIGYVGIALLMVLENIFPPIPSEIIMPFAGYLSGQDRLSLLGIIIAGVFGSILGTLPFYYLGYKIGEDRLVRWAEDHGHWLMISANDIKRAQQWFNRHGKAAILLCRLIPGIRTVISIPAGIGHMNFLSYLVLTCIGTTIWVGILAYLGQILGKNYTVIGQYLNPVSYVVMGGILLFYIGHIIKRKRS